MDRLIRPDYIVSMDNILDRLFIDRSVGMRLWRSANAWHRAVDKALRPVGLTQVQFLLLSGLEDLGRDGAAVRQNELAQRTRVDVMMTSQVLRTLEAKGLVERLSNPRDQRAKVLILTSEGREAIGRAADLMAHCERMFFLRPTDDVAALMAGMRELAPPG
jgi:DNA-binding MarR family transcriptional regulator